VVAAPEIADGVPRVPAEALEDGDGAVEAVAASLARYGCCVLTQAAEACPALPVLLAAARQVHALEAEVRYRTWRGRPGGWRGYAPSTAASEQIAAVVGDVDPAFLTAAASRRFSAFEVGPLWPTARGCPSGGVMDSVQPWPDRPDFVRQVREAFVAAMHFGTDLLRRVLASHHPAPNAPALTFDAPCSSLRLLRYDPGPPGEHLDYELLTMVVSDAPGLEVRDAEGRWRRPEVGPDDVVLMAGDLLEAATGGAIGAALHRVTAAATRHSAVVFVAADFGVEAVMPSTGRLMPFGQFLEGMLVRITPELRARYEAGQLSLPYALPEPNPFRGEMRPSLTGERGAAAVPFQRSQGPREVRHGTEGAFGAGEQAAQRPAAAHPLHPGPGGRCG
jgi:isopenicillin N synthase-like dioxygenase